MTFALNIRDTIIKYFYFQLISLLSIISPEKNEAWIIPGRLTRLGYQSLF